MKRSSICVQLPIVTQKVTPETKSILLKGDLLAFTSGLFFLVWECFSAIHFLKSLIIVIILDKNILCLESGIKIIFLELEFDLF